MQQESVFTRCFTDYHEYTYPNEKGIDERIQNWIEGILKDGVFSVKNIVSSQSTADDTTRITVFLHLVCR